MKLYLANQNIIRIIDFLISFLALLFLSPLFILLSILILIDSKGPIFFKQKRVGKNNIDFYLYKYRTMRPNSEKLGMITVGAKDVRITRIGYYLRKYKLDELPQLLNVLFGQMSLVGPRPEVRKYVNLYTEDEKKILAILPGITDYASIQFSNENEILAEQPDPNKYYEEVIMREKINLNMKYIENYSVYEYFKIIFLTLKKIMN